MTIERHSVVTLSYKLSNHQTGDKIEETTTDHPMVFLYGADSLIPEFERNLEGKKAGDTFDFSIKAADAYGDRSEEHEVMIPLSVFLDESGKINENEIFPGALVPMSDSEGNHLRGQVKEMNDEFIKMDFNHPLSGTDLHFKGEILDVRKATDDEIAHGHVHGPGGHHH